MLELVTESRMQCRFQLEQHACRTAILWMFPDQFSLNSEIRSCANGSARVPTKTSSGAEVEAQVVRKTSG